MMPVRIAILLIFGIGCLKCSEETTSERCKELVNIFTASLEDLSTMDDYEKFINMAKKHLDIDITDPEVREDILCKVAGAKNLNELYEALPNIKGVTSEMFELGYKNFREHLIRYLGGYTNLHRLFRLYADLWKWQSQIKSGDSLMEVTDLPTLTHFLEVMQVRYGSRWMSYIAHAPYQNALVEDPKEFAEKIYYAELPELREVVANMTGLDEEHSSLLEVQFRYQSDRTAEDREVQYRQSEIIADVLVQLGDMGYLNLE